MRHWILETPWWLLILFAVAAVGLLVSGNNRQSSRLKMAGVGVLLAGGILWAVSYFIETPREISIRQSRQFVAAVSARDRGAIEPLLHPKASMLRWNRDDILHYAVDYADTYGLQSVWITGIDADPVDSVVTVTLSVLSRHDAKRAMVDTVPSTWELKWMDTPAGWKLKEIVPIRIMNTERSQLQARLFNEPSRK